MERTAIIDKGYIENNPALFKFYLLTANGDRSGDCLEEDSVHATKETLRKYADNEVIATIKRYHGDFPGLYYGVAVISNGFGEMNPIMNAAFLKGFKKGEGVWVDMNYEGSYTIPTDEVPGTASRILAGEKDLLKVHDYNFIEWWQRFAFCDADLSSYKHQNSKDSSKPLIDK